MTIEGKLVEISETQEVKQSFQKREFVLEFAENPQYPEYLKMELIQTNCQQLDGFKVGDEVTVSLNLKGRKWTDPSGTVKYFNSLQAWKIEGKKGHSAPASAPANTAKSDDSSKGESWMSESFSADDDLPF